MVKVKSIKVEKKGLEAILSPLETQVLNILWEKKSARVKDIYKELRRRRKRVALTSVAVILDRLYNKGVVTRRIERGRGGGHYIYTSIPREKFEESVIESTVNKLIENFGKVAINYFYERFHHKMGKGKKD